MKKWLVDAPSNIALIKYMGRKNDDSKIPANPSLSYTLPHLKSFVELELTKGESRWEPLILDNLPPINLSEKAQKRFLDFLKKLTQVFFEKDESTPSFIVRSCNNFPLGVGLASSASSFAALTLVTTKACAELTQQPMLSMDKLAALSREGSGSSCRSFYTPWALWDNENVTILDNSNYPHLIHQVILLETHEKKISSSQAHQQVKSSAFYEGRVERATERLLLFIQALKNKNWEQLYQIAWDEFQDMHRLFETAIPPFTYQNETSLLLLKKLRTYWEIHGDGPLITMDAGPNIHLLYRPDQGERQQEIHHQLLAGYPYVLSA